MAHALYDTRTRTPAGPVRDAHLRAAAELLALARAAARPVEQTVAAWFRRHRVHGATDRAVISDAVYGTLRRRMFVERRLALANGTPAGATAEPALLVAGWWVLCAAVNPADLPAACDQALLARVLDSVHSAPPAMGTTRVTDAFALPGWLADAFIAQYGLEDSVRLADALAHEGPLTVRANALRTTRDQLRGRLNAEGVTAAPAALSPWGLHLPARTALAATPAFRDGAFEIQDEGSQLLAPLTGARPGTVAVDACAGGGGKTLHLAALMENSGTLYAFDIDARRLEPLTKRARRAGVKNLVARVLASHRDPSLVDLHGRADAVLIDAPCSGTGTLRRDPGLADRLTPKDIERLARTQRELLDAFAPLVKRGGRLVYATCSLLAAENDDVVAAFLRGRDDFSIFPAAGALAGYGVTAPDTGRFLSLRPDTHNSDGFFAAALMRTA